MEKYKVMFESLEWQETMPGARFKIFSDGKKQMRLLELTSEFVEPHWCERGHVGFVLDGELEIDFDDQVIGYSPGSGIFIPPGTLTKHKARSITPSAQLFLVEDV